MPLNAIHHHYYLSGPMIHANGQEGGSKSIGWKEREGVALLSQRLTLSWCDSSILCYHIYFLSQWFLSCWKLHGTVTLLKPRCQTAALLHICLFYNYPQKYPWFRLVAQDEVKIWRTRQVFILFKNSLSTSIVSCTVAKDSCQPSNQSYH